ncbi:rCG24585 [Rattus norvegicus]|uniref:RCG24585 n=1 Tax=Rattus norvegicus TaxID=10116 RepID=A6JBU8_RAT|nr:rCG24585 [Rattus norvegicus]
MSTILGCLSPAMRAVCLQDNKQPM